MTKIYWHRITIKTLFLGEVTYMYPSAYRYWNPVELNHALYDLDLDGYQASEEFAGISYMEAGKNACYYYYNLLEA